jgi:hypothetical protein
LATNAGGGGGAIFVRLINAVLFSIHLEE